MSGILADEGQVPEYLYMPLYGNGYIKIEKPTGWRWPAPRSLHEAYSRARYLADDEPDERDDW